ncbi:MAG: type IV secretory system conjugative DNA transfer family protein [Candidatus Paceibacterota bacterium]|jgi:hypothetical protein
MNKSVSLIFFLIITTVALTIAFLLFFWWRRQRLNNLDLKILVIKIPHHDKENGEKDFIKQINLSEQLFVALSSIGRPYVFEASVLNTGEEIRFYLAVPRSSLEYARKTVQGFFLDAQVEEASDYTIFETGSQAAAGYLTLDKHFVLPVASYRESEADVFSPILSTLSKLAENSEGASVQVVISPIGEISKKEIMNILGKLREGKTLKELTDTSPSLKKVGKELEKMILTNNGGDEKETKLADEEAVKAVQLKISKTLMSVNVRIIAAAATKGRAEDILMSVASSFSKLASPVRNSFKIVKPKKINKLIFHYVFREADDSQAIILNVEELASIFHLPTETSDVPNVTWLRAKEAPPPENLPTKGLILGQSVFRGVEKTICVTEEDRRRHTYIVGQTGTGKSVFIQNMAMQDMYENRGFCVIDPHGELVDKILNFVPVNRIDDVIIFDPGDRSRPLGLNMLEYNLSRPEEKTFIVNEIQAIFNQLFMKETMGPQFEKYMRNTLLLLMDDFKNEPTTLMEVPRIFTDEEFRRRKLSNCTTPLVIDFWTKEVPKTTGEQSLGNFAPYITSKFDGFISNDYLRPIIGQTKSSFNFRQAMDENKIILVNLSKGKLGDLNSALLGMLIVGKLLQAALSRVDIIDEKSRQDFYLYIDEFQNYTTDSIATILSEARKYRLNLTIAHQFIAQLKDNIRESVFGNVGNLIAMRVGSPDAEILVKHFGPIFNERDLIGIENLNAYAKILINGQPTEPFNIKFKWAEGGSTEVREQMKELSRLKYGNDLQEVENDIIKRLRN